MRELDSFGKAPTLLGVGQLTVTKHVHPLEGIWVGELFERSSRPIQLSAAEVELLQAAARC